MDTIFYSIFNFYQSKFREQSYLSTAIVLIGCFNTFHDCDIEIYLVHGKTSKTQKSCARRILNQVQNTICIPLLCPVEVLEFGEEINIEVKLKTRQVDGNFKPDCPSFVEMPGMNNVILKFDENCAIRVNKYVSLIFPEKF